MTQSLDGPRPAQLATLLLAAAGAPPRLRARDQQADLIGGQLRQRILQHLVELDPDPARLQGAMSRIVADLGDPSGPARAMARLVEEELAEVQRNPELTRWLLDEAVRCTR